MMVVMIVMEVVIVKEMVDVMGEVMIVMMMVLIVVKVGMMGLMVVVVVVGMMMGIEVVLVTHYLQVVKGVELTSEGSVEWSQQGVLRLCPHGFRQTQLSHQVPEDGLGRSQQLIHLLS